MHVTWVYLWSYTFISGPREACQNYAYIHECVLTYMYLNLTNKHAYTNDPHTHIHAYIHTLNAHTLKHTHTHTHIFKNTYMHAYKQNTNNDSNTSTHTHTHMYTFTYIHAAGATTASIWPLESL